MTNETQAPAVASRVTIDDVRAVIQGTDPNATNASKVRALLGGRGSFETIQKHLATMRQELATATAPPPSADTVPGAPTMLIDQVWVAAWTSAQVQTMRRTETLAAERDAALLQLEAQAHDLAALVAAVDEQSTHLEQAAAASAAAESTHLASLDKAQASQAAAQTAFDDMVRELERSKASMAQVQADADHAAQLAESGRVMMREELARLTDQIGELKAHLYKRAESSLS